MTVFVDSWFGVLACYGCARVLCVGVWFDFVYLISWVWVVFDRFAMGLPVG